MADTVGTWPLEHPNFTSVQAGVDDGEPNVSILTWLSAVNQTPTEARHLGHALLQAADRADRLVSSPNGDSR